MTKSPYPRYALVASLVVAVLVLTVALFPWRVLRGPLASYAGHQLQREVTIGDLDVALGRITRVELDELAIGNASWSVDQRMAHASRMVLFFSLGALLKGEPDYVQLVQPEVLLEKSGDGIANWHFDGDTTGWPKITAIDVDHGIVRYRDPAVRADVRVSLDTQATEGERSSLHLSGHGTMRGEAFEIEGRTQGLVALRRQGDPYQLALQARSGRTAVSFDGTIVPGDPENVRGTLQLRGPDMSLLYPIVPAPIPWTPAYSLKGDLTHAKGLWMFRRFKGVVGDSDLSGDVQIDVSTPRAQTTADLVSARFNYKDLGGFVGLPPGESLSSPPQTTAQQQEARRRAVSPRVLPGKPLEMAKLREYDADVKFRGTSVKWGDVPMDNLVAHLTLRSGVLHFDPLDFGIADGHVVSNVVLDVNPRIAQAHGQFDARNVELKRIFPRLASPEGSAGRVGGRARFRTEGNSVAELFAAMNGEAAVSMRGGEASTLALVLTNLDLARAATLLLKGDETAEITCAVAALHAKEGLVTPDLLVVDSTAMVITGEGTVDLRQERYDLRLTGDSKQPSLLALRGPIVIGGTFKTPIVGPAVGPVAARVGAAVGLAALAPPLAILPLVDLGNAADVDCRAVNEEARVRTGTTERIVRAPGGQSSAKAARKKPTAEVSNSARPPA